MRRQTHQKGLAQSKRLTWLTAVVALFLAIPGLSLGQEDEIIAGGQLKYHKYCANCHGVVGKGDGIMTGLLAVRPADLTQLRKGNQGEFPFWRVYRIIDGRETTKGHGSREMPLWGAIFQAEEGSGVVPSPVDAVRGRIWQLVYYLESIQEK